MPPRPGNGQPAAGPSAPVPPGGARGLPGRRKGAGGRERLYPPRGTGTNRPGARGPGPAFPAYRIGIKLLSQITSSLGFSAHQVTTAPSRCQAPGPGSFCQKIIIQKKTREKRKDEKEKETGHYIRKERYAGACSRSFYVGEDVEQADIKAEFKHGILTLFVPKKEAKPAVEQKKTIAIEG